MNQGFFLVWRENGGAPTYKHPSLDAAKTEAERLTLLHGGAFHVLASVATATKRNVDWSEHEHADDLPF